MKRLPLILTYLIFLLSPFVLGSCFDKHPDESQIPWARPSSWEDTSPGFGMPGAPF